MVQKYTSAETSINTVNAVYTKMPFAKNSIVLDYGGGKYNTNAEYMKNKGVQVYVFDPYNRTAAHNSKIMGIFKNIKPDYIVNSNVLNVIEENHIVENIVENISKLSGRNTICYFAIYEGNRTGIGSPTVKGYQRNQKTADYVPLISRYFRTVSKKGNIIIAKDRKTSISKKTN